MLITNIVRGGPEVSEVTIQRFFALHVVIFTVALHSAARLSPLAGATPRQRAAAKRRVETGCAAPFESVFPGFLLEGFGDVADRVERAERAGGGVLLHVESHSGQAAFENRLALRGYVAANAGHHQRHLAHAPAQNQERK